jgi:uncharacterized protein YbjT (DUF2867 family)
MKKILVIGASGFAGGALARALLGQGHAVRCLARKPAGVADLAARGCEIVPGDISDPASLRRALAGMDAVYVTIHTLSQQPGGAAGAGFMDVEKTGMQNVVAACRDNGVRRIIYITSFGVAPDAKSLWLRERWQIEQMLIHRGVDSTVLRPGQIVGRGGRGFEMMIGQAKSRFAIVMGNGKNTMRNIALGDLLYYLIGALDEPRTYNQCYDVGDNEALAINDMIDIVADALGRPHPTKIHIPAALLGMLAPLVERMAKLPKGAIKGFVDGMKDEDNGDPMPIRAVLTRPPLSYRAAVAAALQTHTQE